MCNRCQDVCPAHVTGKALSPSALEINKRYVLEATGARLAAGGASPQTLLEATLSPEALWACTACGACVEMNYQGRTVTVTVVDECPIGSNPTCTAGHIDLSRGAWNQLTGNAPGTQIFGVNWRYVPCETEGKVTLELKEPEKCKK